MKKIGLLVLTLVVTKPGWAQPSVAVGGSRLSSNATLASLCSAADAIIVATLRSASQSGSVISVNLHVERAIKGPLAAQDEVFVSWDVKSTAFPLHDPGSITGLWFLKGTADHWVPLPVIVSSSAMMSDFYAVVPRPAPIAPYAVPDTVDAGEKVVAELSAAMAAAGDLNSLDWLWGLSFAKDFPKSAHVALVYRALADSASGGTLASLGIGGLIELGEPDGFTRLAESGLTRLPSSRATDVVARAVCEAPRSSAPVDLLGSLLSATAPRLARCAGQVLRDLHTPATLTYLAGLLNNSSIDLRYEGVAGLASFALRLPVHDDSNTASMEWLRPLSGPAPFRTAEIYENFPAFDAFQKQETQYIDFWKSWWTRNQASLQ
jgi:hypothetical protein